MSTPASVEAAVRAQLPKAAPTSPLSAAEVRSGLEFAARVAATMHGDREWLCDPDPKASRLATLATPAFAARLRAGASRDASYRFLEPRIGPTAGRCDAVRWEAPGVAVGTQAFSVAGARGGTTPALRVTYRGSFGYRLAKADTGMAQLWYGDLRYTMVLARVGTSWKVDAPDDGFYTSVADGWPAEIPLPPEWVPPTGEGLKLPAPMPDETALAAVRDGVGATLRADRTASELRLVGVDRAGKPATSTLTGPLSLRRGDADLSYRGAGFAPLRRLVVAGHDFYEQLQDPGKLYAAPGETLPAKPVWSVRDTRRPGRRTDNNLTPVAQSPYVTLALAAAARAAGPTECPAEVKAARCLLASVGTAEVAAGGGPAAAFAFDQLTSGVPELRLVVGLDDAGRAVAVLGDQDVYSRGTRLGGLRWVLSLSGFSDAAGRPVAAPDPSTVVRAGTYYRAR